MLLISRAEATEKGLCRYFTGEPCPRGHLTERYVANTLCLECGKDSSRKSVRGRQAKNRAQWHKYWYKAHLKRAYGITIEDYEGMLLSQEGRCKICRTDHHQAKVHWHVDHSHKTGTIRGLLCSPCNHMLGNAKDNPAVLASAISYLSENPTPLIDASAMLSMGA